MSPTQNKKAQNLFIVLGCFFLANALLAEFIGVKIFSLENTFGFDQAHIPIMGYDLNFDMTAGVILWPFVFIMTDIINEYFGKKGVRKLSYIAASIIAYSFLMVFLAIQLSPAGFWEFRTLENGSQLPMQSAFESIFGQGLWIIIGSLTAFLLGQLIDVMVFQALKKKTGEKMIWLRATGSTLVSQFIDSFVVLFIAFYIGNLNSPEIWPLSKVLAIGLVNYIYKFSMAIALTPLLYIIHYAIDSYLGKDLANELMYEASANS